MKDSESNWSMMTTYSNGKWQFSDPQTHSTRVAISRYVWCGTSVVSSYRSCFVGLTKRPKSEILRKNVIATNKSPSYEVQYVRIILWGLHTARYTNKKCSQYFVYMPTLRNLDGNLVSCVYIEVLGKLIRYSDNDGR